MPPRKPRRDKSYDTHTVTLDPVDLARIERRADARRKMREILAARYGADAVAAEPSAE
ncbi:hypothetical protein HQ312_02590 [Rhodococcus sp. BP-316]|uniref:hypothetical protein n=1 Tax=Rhodococcus sp. BP-316 TaxID=2739445 RepID=UPI001C9A9A9E|nr:hypothetical protein [Rhodococcus sp. BP-316]MBY6679929.1 hypothetical protein [Rhodococcus sp. BP-316]